MKLFIKKVFKLSDIKYFWLLLTSMSIFVFALCNNKANPDISTTMEWLTYGGALACAFVWALLNYIGQIKINALYRKHNSIDTFIDSLVMNKEEKDDLQTYLNDYVKDMEKNGRTKEEAVKTAIAQFQVQEFTEISKYSRLFELPTHYYLLGYVVIFGALIIVTKFLLATAIPNIFFLYAIIFTLILYAFAFIVLMMLYRVIDVLITKKILN
jgi:hypothetical protein